MTALKPRDRYKLLIGIVVPRPIAFVTSQSPAGLVNAAPFSFFNLFSSDPPIVALGIEEREGGTLKDTTANILATGEFVINMVDEALAERMNLCSTDFPPEVSEVEAVGLATVPSVNVAPPRIADAPASFECKLWRTIELNATRKMLLGEIVHLAVRDDLVNDRMHVDAGRLRAIGRFGGPLYNRTRDLFEMDRVSYADFVSRTPAPAGGRSE